MLLRLGRREPVGLLDEPLVIRRGGHADQLSRSLWGMDRYRVLALQKLLRSGLDGSRREAAIAALRRKVEVLASGARKRGKARDANVYEDIVAEFTQEQHDGKGNPRLLDDERLSPADAGALA
jgi:hypothetical protein